MQAKIKAVLRSSRRHKSPSSSSPRASYESSEPASPRTDRHATPSGHARVSSDVSTTASPSTRRGRAMSSAHDDQRAHNVPAPQSGAAGHAPITHSDSANGSIANDYKAYLPALASADDSHKTRRQEENVADPNMLTHSSSPDAALNKPLPKAPGKS